MRHAPCRRFHRRPLLARSYPNVLLEKTAHVCFRQLEHRDGARAGDLLRVDLRERDELTVERPADRRRDADRLAQSCSSQDLVLLMRGLVELHHLRGQLLAATETKRHRLNIRRPSGSDPFLYFPSCCRAGVRHLTLLFGVKVITPGLEQNHVGQVEAPLVFPGLLFRDVVAVTLSHAFPFQPSCYIMSNHAWPG